MSSLANTNTVPTFDGANKLSRKLWVPHRQNCRDNAATTPKKPSDDNKLQKYLLF
jgi:hypothetical protein